MDACGSKFKRLRRCTEYSKWSDLPICMLCEIIDRLILFDDYVRFGAVCVSWRFAFLEDKKKQISSSSLPLLLIPPHSESQTIIINKGVRSLYSVSNDKVCNLQVQVPHNIFCRGSNFGWLVTMQREEKHGHNNNYVFHVQLHNPFLSDKHNIINLPSLDNVVKNDGDDQKKPFLYLRKAVLSSDPLFTPNNDFVVLSIISRFSKLVFYRKGDKDWTPIQWENQECRYFDDVIYFNQSRLFYAVLNHTGAVLAIDLNTGGRQGQQQGNISKPTQVAPPTQKDGSCRKRYLVETSSGDLLQVLKELKSIGRGRSTVINFKFEVFKLDPVKVDWIQIYNIGDIILFLGDNGSIARAASGCPGCKPNSIYYTFDLSFEQNSGRLYGPQFTGIYNLEDGTIQPHYPTASKIIFPIPIWFEPTMQRCITSYLNKESCTKA